MLSTVTTVSIHNLFALVTSSPVSLSVLFEALNWYNYTASVTNEYGAFLLYGASSCFQAMASLIAGILRHLSFYGISM
jgi:hypothetical protein